MSHDAKHGFLSEKRGGCGLQSFTRECMSALLCDIEVYITNDNSLPAHANHKPGRSYKAEIMKLKFGRENTMQSKHCKSNTTISYVWEENSNLSRHI